MDKLDICDYLNLKAHYNIFLAELLHFVTIDLFSQQKHVTRN